MIDRVQVLQYCDDPEIEPGELLARVVLQAGESGEERKQAMRAFDEEHRDAIHELRRDLDRVSEIGLLEIIVGDKDAEGPVPVRRMRLAGLPRVLEGAEGVRWARARIRERPAYAKLRERAREIEDLKAQF